MPEKITRLTYEEIHELDDILVKLEVQNRKNIKKGGIGFSHASDTRPRVNNRGEVVLANGKVLPPGRDLDD